MKKNFVFIRYMSLLVSVCFSLFANGQAAGPVYPIFLSRRAFGTRETDPSSGNATTVPWYPGELREGLAAELASTAPPSGNVFISDIDNFWIAYDSVVSTADSVKQVNFIQSLYVDKGTEGLKLFMKVRDYTPALWVHVIRAYPKFWRSIRPNTLLVRQKKEEILQAVDKLKAAYSNYKPGRIYFTIGALKAAGTTEGRNLLIGAEIATGNASTDASEFPNKRLENFFKPTKTDNIVPITIHEYVHTQQKEEGKTLLGQSICEGACDFITEMVLGKTLLYPYLQYGRAHEAELKARFKQEMYNEDYSEWLYNSSKTAGIGDLGYFMGYAICKAYYERAEDKAAAISAIIELPYSDRQAIEVFLDRSGYYR